MSSNDAYDEMLECFLECAVHTLLYARQIYQLALFEQRRYLGITVWQCRHPQVVEFIKRVFANARTLLRRGLVEKMVFVTTSDNRPWDHTTVRCEFATPSTPSSASRSEVLAILEEELQSCMLRLSMTDALLGKVPDGSSSWTVMMVVKPTQTTGGDGGP